MIIYYSGSGFVKDKTEAEDLMVVSIMLSAWEILTEVKSQRESSVHHESKIGTG